MIQSSQRGIEVSTSDSSRVLSTPERSFADYGIKPDSKCWNKTVILVPLFIYIVVASQITMLESLKHLDSVGTRLRFELHIHRVPQPTGFPAWGADAGLTGQQVGQPHSIPLGRWGESSTFSTLASPLRAEAEIGSCQTCSCGRANPEKQPCNNIFFFL